MEEKIDMILRYSLLAAKNVLTLEDVALLTGLSRSWLYKATCKNEIPFYKPNGKMLYFDRKEIEDWMRQGRVKTNAELEQEAANYLINDKARKG
jgi:excisionase family DNA binding protein